MSNIYSELRDSELANLFKGGNIDAFTTLAARFVIPIRSKAASFRSLETEDLCQEGLIALMYAARSYDSEKEASFSTYANACIYNRFVSLLRKNENKNVVPQSETVSISENSDDLMNLVSSQKTDPQFLIIQRENLQRLWSKLRDILSDNEMKVFNMYISGYKYGEISKALSVSYKFVDNAITRIKRKLKANLL